MMLIKITNSACGLEKGKEYDLCDMSAQTLLSKGHAVMVRTQKEDNAAQAIKPLHKMNKAELVQYAQANQLEVDVNLNKKQLFSAIVEAEQQNDSKDTDDLENNENLTD